MGERVITFNINIATRQICQDQQFRFLCSSVVFFLHNHTYCCFYTTTTIWIIVFTSVGVTSAAPTGVTSALNMGCLQTKNVDEVPPNSGGSLVTVFVHAGDREIQSNESGSSETVNNKSRRTNKRVRLLISFINYLLIQTWGCVYLNFLLVVCLICILGDI